MPHRWLQVLAPLLDQRLQERGVGTQEGNHNRFCVVQFGARGYQIKAQFLDGIDTFFRSQDMTLARRKLKNNGYVADGYEALKFALDHVPFRNHPSVGKSIVMATSTGRTNLADSYNLTLPLLSDLIGRLNVTLDVIVNMSLQSTKSPQIPLGLSNYSSTILYKNETSYELITGAVKVSSSHGNTLASYADLATSLGGVAWSLGAVKDANVSIMSSLVTAMISGWSLLEKEACQRCQCVEGVGVCVTVRDVRQCRTCNESSSKVNELMN